MKLIGISGTNGSGKDTLGEILADDYGWLFISVTELLRSECRRRGLAVERMNLRKISAEWRKEFGLAVLIDMAYKNYLAVSRKFNGLVMSSLRNPAEADRVHELGGIVVWIDAEPKIRYARIAPRGRSPEDQKTYQEFLDEEKTEMEPGSSEQSLHTAGVKAKADIFISNDTDSLEDFKKTIRKTLEL